MDRDSSEGGVRDRQVTELLWDKDDTNKNQDNDNLKFTTKIKTSTSFMNTVVKFYKILLCQRSYQNVQFYHYLICRKKIPGF